MSGGSLRSSRGRPLEKARETKEVGSLRWFKVFLSTFFFTGYFPKCPGTAASAAAFLIFWFIIRLLTPAEVSMPSFIIKVTAGAFVSCLIISIWLSPLALKYFGQSDPKQFVIDEAAGMFLVFIFVPPDLFTSLVGFALFRIFDIFKPWPTRRLEKLPPRFALVADDLMAAVYAIVCLFVFRLTLL